MQPVLEFDGFSQKTREFFISLKRNNSKEWFSRHKQDFENHVMAPAKAFVVAIGERLKEIAPEIIAIPKTDRSIFRIYRDTRFSADKSPYKNHLGVFFWEGSRPKMECPGFYFHLEPPRLMLGVGLYMFPKNALEHYRHAVVHPEYGAELGEIIRKMTAKGLYTLGGKHYKRIPAGFDASHPNAELLLYNGLHSGVELDIPDELYSAALIDFCMAHFAAISPLHRWLVDFNKRIS